MSSTWIQLITYYINMHEKWTSWLELHQTNACTAHGSQSESQELYWGSMIQRECISHGHAPDKFPWLSTWSRSIRTQFVKQHHSNTHDTMALHCRYDMSSGGFLHPEPQITAFPPFPGTPYETIPSSMAAFPDMPHYSYAFITGHLHSLQLRLARWIRSRPEQCRSANSVPTQQQITQRLAKTAMAEAGIEAGTVAEATAH